MSLTLMISVVLTMICLQFLIRKVLFNRNVDLDLSDSFPGEVLYPCDGRLVYTRMIEGEAYAMKLNEKISIGFLDETCYHIGVYMTPYDRHYVVAPFRGTVKKIEKVNAGVHLPMLDLFEYARSGLFLSFNDWFKRKFNSYLKDTEKVVITIDSHDYGDFKVILIGDKCVNKIDLFVEEGSEVIRGQKLGFIRRGSQVDLIFNAENLSKYPKKIGCKITAGDTLGKLER